MSTNLIQECHRRAAEARRIADAKPAERTKFLEAERRWLLAARSISSQDAVCAPAGILKRDEPMSPNTKQMPTLGPQPLSYRGRPPTKFTAENIQQIKNLLAEGKSREEIANLIGVTVGSLQVTCSRLGISLRRSIINAADALLQGHARHNNGRMTSDPGPPGGPLPEPNTAHSAGTVQVGPFRAPAPHGQGETQTTSVSLAIRMQYKGREQTTELSLTEDMLSQLVMEAQFRNMSVTELVGELMTATLRDDLFRQMLEAEQDCE